MDLVVFVPCNKKVEDIKMDRNFSYTVLFAVFIVMALIAIGIMEGEVNYLREQINAYNKTFETLVEKHDIVTEMIQLRVYDQRKAEELKKEREAIRIVFQLIEESPYFPDLPREIQDKVNRLALPAQKN